MKIFLDLKTIYKDKKLVPNEFLKIIVADLKQMTQKTVFFDSRFWKGLSALNRALWWSDNQKISKYSFGESIALRIRNNRK